MANPRLWQAAQARLEGLPAGLRDHCQRVSEKARELARRYGEEEERVALAALLHDVARARGTEELLAQAEALGLSVSQVERAMPVLLHGPVAAELARRELGVSDEEVLAAVAWHSTGRKGMTPLEKVVFLADKLDPGKEGYYPPGLEGLGQAAERGLDQALLVYFDWQLRHLLERGALIHPAMVEARNDVLGRG